MTSLSPIANLALTPAVEAALRDGAWVSYSVSGGKDSSAAIIAAEAALDAIGHPRDKRLMMHADLGRIEWAETLPHVQRLASVFNLPLRIVEHTSHDMISRWERRGDLGRERWAEGSTTNLIGPWSSASLRFCTSEMKIHVMSRAKRELSGPVVTVMGIRREESTGRAKTPYEAPDTAMKRYGRSDCFVWNPVADWTKSQVFAAHEEKSIPLHDAYGLGSTRLSCSFCVLANLNDLTVASAQDGNLETYRLLVEMEAKYGFSFQASRWLADVRPQLLTTGLLSDIERAKIAAARRRELEKSYPEAWRKRDPEGMDDTSVRAVVAARTKIAKLHGIESFEPIPPAMAEPGLFDFLAS